MHAAVTLYWYAVEKSWHHSDVKSYDISSGIVMHAGKEFQENKVFVRISYADKHGFT